MKAIILSLTLLSTLFASPQNCDVTIDTSKNSTIKDKRVKKAIITLKSTLQKKLKKAIKDKGILNAAKFCNANATSITKEINKDMGAKVSIKRITLKPRNPANLANQTEAEVLNTFLNTHSKEMTKRQIGKTTRYYQPMYINKPICLSCHGDIKKTSAMGSFLAEHYPEDKATGYKMGDFRGAMVIDIIR